MSFSEKYMDSQRWWDFDFYKAADPATAGTDLWQDTIAAGTPIKLRELRVHCSVAFASAQYLVIRLSDAQLGSAYNVTLLSYAMNGVQDLFVHYSDPIFFHSTDNLVIELSTSAANMIGIQAIGWAVVG
jgi:hypothetical protein